MRGKIWIEILRMVMSNILFCIIDLQQGKKVTLIWSSDFPRSLKVELHWNYSWIWWNIVSLGEIDAFFCCPISSLQQSSFLWWTVCRMGQIWKLTRRWWKVVIAFLHICEQYLLEEPYVPSWNLWCSCLIFSLEITVGTVYQCCPISSLQQSSF